MAVACVFTTFITQTDVPFAHLHIDCNFCPENFMPAIAQMRNGDTTPPLNKNKNLKKNINPGGLMFCPNIKPPTLRKRWQAPRERLETDKIPTFFFHHFVTVLVHDFDTFHPEKIVISWNFAENWWNSTKCGQNCMNAFGRVSLIFPPKYDSPQNVNPSPQGLEFPPTYDRGGYIIGGGG